MTDAEAALLRAVQESPGDPAPRLVYADWLEEQGDVRAEVIRIHCELTQSTRRDLRFFSLLEREEQLRRRVDPAWLLVMGYATSVHIRRRALLTRLALRRPLDRRLLQELGPVSWVELAAAIERLLKQEGRYPVDAEMMDGDPPLYFDAQIRRRENGSWLVVNCQLMASDGTITSSQTYADARAAVRRFMQSEVRAFNPGLAIAGVHMQGVNIT